MVSLELEPKNVKAALIARISKAAFYELRKKNVANLKKVRYSYVVPSSRWEYDSDVKANKEVKIHLRALTDVRALRARLTRIESLTEYYNRFFWDKLANLAKECDVEVVAWPCDDEKTSYHLYHVRDRFSKSGSLGSIDANRLLSDLQESVIKRKKHLFLDEETARKLNFVYKHEYKLRFFMYKLRSLFRNVIEACVIDQKIDHDMITITIGGVTETLILNRLHKDLVDGIGARQHQHDCYLSTGSYSNIFWLNGTFSHDTITK